MVTLDRESAARQDSPPHPLTITSYLLNTHKEQAYRRRRLAQISAEHFFSNPTRAG